MTSQIITSELLERRFKIKCDDDNAETLKLSAKYLSERIEQAQEQNHLLFTDAMVLAMAIPNIIGVIIAVVTSKEISNKLIKIARTTSGNTLGIKTKSVVLIFLINTHKQIKPTMKATKNDLNCVSSIKLLS